PELTVIDRAAGVATVIDDGDGRADRGWDGDGVEPADVAASATEAVARVMPLPTARERRVALRARGAELLGMLEGIPPDAPEAATSRASLTAEFASLATRAV